MYVLNVNQNETTVLNIIGEDDGTFKYHVDDGNQNYTQLGDRQPDQSVNLNVTIMDAEIKNLG